MFRLIRRTLLCLLVGVTAFGVSGWLLRPKASWEVEVPQGAEFVEGPLRTRDHPIWLTLRNEKNGALRDSFVALAPTNGEARWTMKPPPGFVVSGDGVRREDGRFVVKGNIPQFKDGANVVRTWFAVVDSKRCSIDLERTFEGEWNPTESGHRAWIIVTTDGGFKLVVRRIDDGAVAVELPFTHGYSGFNHLAVDVSPDGKILAVCESVKDQPGNGFEIWNVEQGKLVGRYDLPAKRSNGVPIQAVTPDFRDSRILWIQPEKDPPLIDSTKQPWSEIFNFDVERGEYLQDWTPPPPPCDAPVVFSEHELGDGESIWTAYHFGGGSLVWFSTFRGERQLREWRKAPHRTSSESYGFLNVGIKIVPVPRRDEFIAAVSRPPLRDSLPDSVAGLVPKRFDIDSETSPLIWHDWKSNTWRDIGCSEGDDTSTQVREDALLCLRKSDDRTVLQSWPLPPRDPKPPAAIIGIASATLVWWMCARRHAKRLRMAA